mmetsp:Transcript_1714/g.6103  ORF Transcript_1714/g.6103 Transcript_1714/m.6103 type:complete len:281 (+) Transcript_1714:1264-2106(+)
MFRNSCSSLSREEAFFPLAFLLAFLSFLRAPSAAPSASLPPPPSLSLSPSSSSPASSFSASLSSLRARSSFSASAEMALCLAAASPVVSSCRIVSCAWWSSTLSSKSASSFLLSSRSILQVSCTRPASWCSLLFSSPSSRRISCTYENPSLYTDSDPSSGPLGADSMLALGPALAALLGVAAAALLEAAGLAFVVVVFAGVLRFVGVRFSPVAALAVAATAAAVFRLAETAAAVLPRSPSSLARDTAAPPAGDALTEVERELATARVLRSSRKSALLLEL